MCQSEDDLETNLQMPSARSDCKCESTCRSCKFRSTCKYVQPEIRALFKPPLSCLLASDKLEDFTTYKQSYPPPAHEKQKSYRHPATLKIGEGNMLKETINRLTYTKHENASRASMCIPSQCQPMRKNTTERITTHRHDYPKQPLEKVAAFIPTASLKIGDEPISDVTTCRLSYVPINLAQNPRKQYKEQPALSILRGKMDASTTYKLAYLPLRHQAQVEKAPLDKRGYFQSTLPISGDTVYRSSYLPSNGESRRHSYKPIPTCLPNYLKMDGTTVYRTSYLPTESIKDVQYVPEGALCISKDKLSYDTIHKLSYQPFKDAAPATTVIPQQKNCFGKGPMQNTTTQRYDYIPKPLVKREGFKIRRGLFESSAPLSRDTTSRLSYQAHDLDKVNTTPYHICPELKLSTSKFDEKTTYNMSYVEHAPQPPQNKPWTKRPQCSQSKPAINGCTTHSLSYQPPGRYVKCRVEDPNCFPCHLNENPEPCGNLCCCRC